LRRRLRKFVKEIFRRKVVRVVIAYLSIFLATVLAVTQLQDLLGVSKGFVWIIIGIGILAIPLVVYLAWRYDIVPPQFVRDVNDVRAENPGLSWARLRHETTDAGYVLLGWMNADGVRIEKRFFQPVAIGREMTNDIELADERVSRHHAVLWAEDGVWRIRDMDSANGTFVGHARVSGTSELPQSCELRFHIAGPTVVVQISRAAETRVS
jgi:FHA domain